MNGMVSIPIEAFPSTIFATVSRAVARCIGAATFGLGQLNLAALYWVVPSTGWPCQPSAYPQTDPTPTSLG